MAATIAARASLAMGVGTLNNQDHALIYSDGTLAIGGQLAEDGSLSGRAGVFNNHSATLESAGDMALDIQQINNYNDHLVTKDVMVEQSWRHEAALKGSVQRFDWSLVDTSYKNKYGVHDAIMPDGTAAMSSMNTSTSVPLWKRRWWKAILAKSSPAASSSSTAIS